MCYNPRHLFLLLQKERLLNPKRRMKVGMGHMYSTTSEVLGQKEEGGIVNKPGVLKKKKKQHKTKH